MLYIFAFSLIVVALFFMLVSLIRRIVTFNEAQKPFQELLDNTNIGYCKYKLRDGVILEANKGFVEMLNINMSVKNVIGKSLSELIIYVQEEDNVREIIKTRGALKNYEYHFKTLNGKEKCLLMNAYLNKDSHTRENVVEALVEDITEERLSYEAMVESEERYKKLFMNSGDIVVIYKKDNSRIEEINPMTEIILGYNEEELVGYSFENLFHPTSRKILNECQKDIMFRGSCNLDAVVVCKNGNYLNMGVTLSTFEHKEETLVMAIMKDISSLVKSREEEVKRKNEMEDFWKASLAREERIKDLRREIDESGQETKEPEDGHEAK